MKNLFLFAALSLVLVSLQAPKANAESQIVCGDIKGLYFKEFSARIRAFGYLDRLRTVDGEPLPLKKVALTDPKAVFKLARAISITSIQNSDQLTQDLRASQFEWDSLVGPELSPNPYEEDFSTCIKADLDLVSADNTLHSVIEIIDIYEDGYPITDL